MRTYVNYLQHKLSNNVYYRHVLVKPKSAAAAILWQRKALIFFEKNRIIIPYSKNEKFKFT
jgi:hypothetical protein